MASIINAENLQKRYIISHQRRGQKDTFRETVASGCRAMLQRARHPLSPNREKVDLEEFWALREVNFEIEEGERIGVIGQNGAGKSTLLKVLSRITEPTTGRVRLRGRTSSLLEVGTGFHPELTGRENIFLNGAILGMGRHEIIRKFDDIVAFAEVEQFLDTPVKRYSSGMYVRLAFAVAAHLDPEILIIDEVLAVGDAQFQAKCLGKMKSVAGSGRTVLFVSHNMHSVRELCSRGILLHQGRVVKDGPIDDVIDHYLANDFAQEGEVSLEGWKGTRTSPGTARVAAVRTRGVTGETSSTFDIGTPVIFEADVSDLPVNGYCLSFMLWDKRGVMVYHIRSQDSQLQTTEVGSWATVRMTIPEVQLVEGSYTVTVWLGNHLNQIEDRVDNALSFHVLNRGHSVARLDSVIHETGQWELVKAEKTKAIA